MPPESFSESSSDIHSLISPPTFEQPAQPPQVPPPPSGKLLTFFLACIVFLGIAAALKATKAQFPFLHPQTPAASQITESTAPVMDGSFLDQQKTPAQTARSAQPAQDTPAKGGNTAAPAVPAVPAAPKAPSDAVTADGYIVGDVTTGKIYLQKNPDQVLPVASMSKLITAIIATDSYAASTPIRITQLETEVPADASALRAGETFPLSELLYPMLLNSSNVAAEAIASSTDRIPFLEHMSSYAWDIGMKNAYFADPTGLSDHNQGSASDFFALARYLYAKRPDILAITRTAATSTATTTDHGAHDFTSIHPFVNDPRFLGGKTGHTPEALDTMMTILNIHGHPMAFIVLHSSQGRTIDTQILIDRLEKII